MVELLGVRHVEARRIEEAEGREEGPRAAEPALPAGEDHRPLRGSAFRMIVEKHGKFLDRGAVVDDRVVVEQERVGA